jgi:hypothetical protein
MSHCDANTDHGRDDHFLWRAVTSTSGRPMEFFCSLERAGEEAQVVTVEHEDTNGNRICVEGVRRRMLQLLVPTNPGDGLFMRCREGRGEETRVVLPDGTEWQVHTSHRGRPGSLSRSVRDRIAEGAKTVPAAPCTVREAVAVPRIVTERERKARAPASVVASGLLPVEFGPELGACLVFSSDYLLHKLPPPVSGQGAPRTPATEPPPYDPRVLDLIVRQWELHRLQPAVVRRAFAAVEALCRHAARCTPVENNGTS